MSIQNSTEKSRQSESLLAEALDILLEERVDVANLQSLDAIQDRLNEVQDKLQENYDSIAHQEGDAQRVAEKVLHNFENGKLGRLLDRLNETSDADDDSTEAA